MNCNISEMLDSRGVVEHALVWDLQIDRYHNESGRFVRCDPCEGELTREPVWSNGMFVGHVWACDCCHESITESDLVSMLCHAEENRDTSDWEYDLQPDCFI